jgi:transposase
MKFPEEVAVFLATGRVDLRWSFDALSGLVKERMRQDPRSGMLFVFLNRRRTRVKILFYDRTGYCLLHKRLDRGTFPTPIVVEPNAQHVVLSAAQLEVMFEGLTVLCSGRNERRLARRRLH